MRRLSDRDAVKKTRRKCRQIYLTLCGPSSPIVRLAPERSRRFALLRPRCARLAALTAPSANLVRQLSTAQVNGDGIKSAHRFTNLLTTRIGGAIVKSSFAGGASQPPPHRPVWSTLNRRPQVTVLSLLSTHSLVALSRDHTSADHPIVAGLHGGPGYTQDPAIRGSLFEEFCDEFTREMNRLRMEHRASLSAAEREIERIEVRRKKLIEMVMDGVAPSEVKDEINVNAAKREELKAKLAAADEPPPLLHPGTAEVYRGKVTDLARALEHPETRSEATESLRGLIEAIVLTPDQGEPPSRAGEDTRSGEPRLRIELKGNLAAMLSAAQNAKRSPETGDLSLQVVMVAGACNRLYRRLCWAAA